MAEFSLNLMRQRETTKVHRDRGKMLGVLAVGIVFFGGGFVLFWRNAGTGKIPPLKEDFLWFAFAFFAVAIPHFALKMFDRRPALEFSDAGLCATDIAADVIPWPAIRGATIRTYKRNKILELQIDPDVVRGLRPNFVQAKLRFVNKMLGFPHYIVNASVLDHDADFLLQLINFYLQKNQNAEARMP
jgi:hypothetical protein